MLQYQPNSEIATHQVIQIEIWPRCALRQKRDSISFDPPHHHCLHQMLCHDQDLRLHSMTGDCWSSTSHTTSAISFVKASHNRLAALLLELKLRQNSSRQRQNSRSEANPRAMSEFLPLNSREVKWLEQQKEGAKNSSILSMQERDCKKQLNPFNVKKDIGKTQLKH